MEEQDLSGSGSWARAGAPAARTSTSASAAQAASARSARIGPVPAACAPAARHVWRIALLPPSISSPLPSPDLWSSPLTCITFFSSVPRSTTPIRSRAVPSAPCIRRTSAAAIRPSARSSARLTALPGPKVTAARVRFPQRTARRASIRDPSPSRFAAVGVTRNCSVPCSTSWHRCARGTPRGGARSWSPAAARPARGRRTAPGRVPPAGPRPPAGDRSQQQRPEVLRVPARSRERKSTRWPPSAVMSNAPV